MARTLALTAALAACSTAFTGCAVESIDGRFPPQERVGADAGPVDLGAVLDATATPISTATGTWLLFTEDRRCLFAVGDAIEAMIWSYYIVETEPTGPGRPTLTQRTRMCRQELSPLALGFLSVVPDAVPDGAPDAEFDGFLADFEPGSAYLTGTLAELWGAEGVAADEALPLDPDDPRLVDQDGDDEPAVTFPVTTPTGNELCQVFVTQRMTHALRGAVVDARRIEGTTESTTEKNVLAASSDLCASGDFVQNDAQDTFSLVRIDGVDDAPDLDADGDGAVDCDELRAELDEIIALYGLTRSEPDADTWCAD